MFRRCGRYMFRWRGWHLGKSICLLHSGTPLNPLYVSFIGNLSSFLCLHFSKQTGFEGPNSSQIPKSEIINFNFDFINPNSIQYLKRERFNPKFDFFFRGIFWWEITINRHFWAVIGIKAVCLVVVVSLFPSGSIVMVQFDSYVRSFLSFFLFLFFVVWMWVE